MTPLLLAMALSQAGNPNPDAQAWRLFRALNQPAAEGDSPIRYAAQPRIWETWPTAAATFRRDGADPGSWNPSSIRSDRFEGIVPAGFSNLRHVEGSRMVAVSDPLAVAKRLVEVRLNPLSYDFIRRRGLYTVDGQRQAVNAAPVKFPAGATQLKAGWRPISRQQRDQYYTMTLRMADGSMRWYGLAALNLAFKTASGDWLWASFEHVDQPSHAAGRAGKVWTYYRLRGTQTRFLEPSGQPARLGNAVLESGLGDSASCMTCHARATISLDEDGGRLAVFAPAPPGIRRGYVGLPDTGWFGHTDAQGQWQATFAQLDFVWSLSQAAPRGAALSSTGMSP